MPPTVNAHLLASVWERCRGPLRMYASSPECWTTHRSFAKAPGGRPVRATDPGSHHLARLPNLQQLHDARLEPVSTTRSKHCFATAMGRPHTMERGVFNRSTLPRHAAVRTCGPPRWASALPPTSSRQRAPAFPQGGGIDRTPFKCGLDSEPARAMTDADVTNLNPMVNENNDRVYVPRSIRCRASSTTRKFVK